MKKPVLQKHFTIPPKIIITVNLIKKITVMRSPMLEQKFIFNKTTKKLPICQNVSEVSKRHSPEKTQLQHTFPIYNKQCGNQTLL